MLGRRSLILNWLPVVAWMALIFYLSTDALSSQRTSRIIGPILRWLKPDISDEAVRQVQFAARKTAHVGNYAILSVLLWRARPRRGTQWDWKVAGWALALSVLYAISDEWHQSFVPSRGASAADVLIDTAGAAIGLAFLWAIRTMISRRKARETQL